MDLNVQFLGDASKNCIVWVRGAVFAEDSMKLFPIMDLKDVASPPSGKQVRTLQLASVLWTIQEKMGLYLWLAEEYLPGNMLLVMESRNFIRYDKPLILDNWAGKLYIQPFKVDEPKRFSFHLDFDKVMER
jgi:hypothetical protein